MALPITVIVLPIILAIPLSGLMARIIDGNYRTWPVFEWFEKRLDSGHQNWKQYTVTLLFFNTCSIYSVIWCCRCSRGCRSTRAVSGCWRPARSSTLSSRSPPTPIFQLLLGRSELFQFQPDLFLLTDVLSVGSHRPVRFDGDHPGIPERSAPRQLLRRYVAGGRLSVSPGRVRPGASCF